MQTAMAALALGGLPLILMAFWGVFAKAEAPIRLFLYYMLLLFVVDVVFIVKDLIFVGPCEHMPSIISKNGAAFTCGIARVFNCFTIFVVLGIEFYFFFVVMSYCEELSLGGPDLSDLAYDGDRK